MSEHHLMIIGADRVDADESSEVLSPYDGRVLGSVPVGTTDHLDAAIALYREGEKTGGTVDQNKLDTLEAMRKAATRYVVSFSAIATFDQSP